MAQALRKVGIAEVVTAGEGVTLQVFSSAEASAALNIFTVNCPRVVPDAFTVLAPNVTVIKTLSIAGVTALKSDIVATLAATVQEIKARDKEEQRRIEPRLAHTPRQSVGGPIALFGVAGEGPIVDVDPVRLVAPGLERAHGDSARPLDLARDRQRDAHLVEITRRVHSDGARYLRGSARAESRCVRIVTWVMSGSLPTACPPSRSRFIWRIPG